MASEGGAGSYYQYHAVPRELGSVARLLAARMPIVAECFSSSQSTRPGALGAFVPHLVPMDSATPRSASLSSCSLRRHPSSVRAVCVNALARICAGGDQRWSSLPRPEPVADGPQSSITKQRSGLVARRQVIEQAIALFGCYRSTPPSHFRHFPIPLSACEALLAHHVLVVADQAGGLVAVGCGLSFGLGRCG